jgi:hypothetical protein
MDLEFCCSVFCGEWCEWWMKVLRWLKHCSVCFEVYNLCRKFHLYNRFEFLKMWLIRVQCRWFVFNKINKINGSCIINWCGVFPICWVALFSRRIFITNLTSLVYVIDQLLCLWRNLNFQLENLCYFWKPSFNLSLEFNWICHYNWKLSMKSKFSFLRCILWQDFAKLMFSFILWC